MSDLTLYRRPAFGLYPLVSLISTYEAEKEPESKEAKTNRFKKAGKGLWLIGSIHFLERLKII